MGYSEEPHSVVSEREVEAHPLGGEVSRSMRSRGDLWRVAAAEALGTALLVLLSCAPGCSAGAGASPAPLVQRALTGGLVVAALVQCFDHISGAQINPTVTLAAVLSGRVPPVYAAAMCSAQLVGGALGASLLMLFRPRAVTLCVTKPVASISVFQALAVEMLLGSILALANLASWDPRNRRLVDSWPLRIGIIVVAMTLIGGDLTGASMNPARSFAPALLSGDWEALWVYWLGPLGGSLVATALYCTVWRVGQDAPARGATHASPVSSAPPSRP